MVSFKKLFLATSLLLSGVAAAPAPAGALDVAAAEARAVNDFAIEDTLDARAKKCRPTKRGSLERRVLHDGKDANNVVENEFVTPVQIKSNGGKATVTDLSGCTALFFYMDTTLRRVAHILCGNEEKDAKTAAQQAGGATSVTIGANTQKLFEDARRGVLEGASHLKINAEHIYSTAKVTDKIAITLHGNDGTTTITEGTGPRICKQS